MNPTEATSNIVIALINSKYVQHAKDVPALYKEIYKAVAQPNN